MEMLQRTRYQNRLWIETFSGAFGCDDDLPMDPWLLGFLLGDGALGGSSLRFSTASEDILQRIEATIGPELSINAAGGYDHRIVQSGGANRVGVQGVQTDPLVAALRELDLWNCQAHTKFIPARYLQGSRHARQRLMAGLLDADGWVEKWGSIRIGSASERMAEGIVHLARSLGGTASHRAKATRYTDQGASHTGPTTWVCNIQHPDPAELVDLPSKRDRLVAGRQRQRGLNLVDIEPTRITETQCIAVTHPSRLYITDDFIVTHNTAFALNIAENLSLNAGQPVAVFSLEMSKQQLAQRLMSSRAGVDGQRMRRNMLNEDEFQRLQQVVTEARDAPMFIDDTPGMTVLEMRAKSRRLAARHDIKAIFIDYLQLMSSPGAESRQQEVSQISRGVKALARELNIPVVTLSQLNRNPEGRADNKPLLSDLRESGSIEQDSDVVMMLHREEYYHKDEAWALENPEKVGLAEVIIAKQRNGPTGIANLHFNSLTTRFAPRAGRSAQEHAAI
jgi:replicative DNA helicase